MAKAKTETAQPAQMNHSKYVVKALVTLPLWKWQDGVEKAFRIETPIVLGKAVKDRGPAGVKGEEKGGPKGVQMEPAHICNVTNLETGELMQIITGSVLKGNLEDNYPDQSYVGKCFISTQSKIEGKRYKGYSLAEIEAPTA